MYNANVRQFANLEQKDVSLCDIAWLLFRCGR